jgi:hypothetical protein
MEIFLRGASLRSAIFGKKVSYSNKPVTPRNCCGFADFDGFSSAESASLSSFGFWRFASRRDSETLLERAFVLVSFLADSAVFGFRSDFRTSDEERDDLVVWRSFSSIFAADKFRFRFVARSGEFAASLIFRFCEIGDELKLPLSRAEVRRTRSSDEFGASSDLSRWSLG